MKFKILVCAATAAGMLVACNREQTVSINHGEAIAFRGRLGLITKGHAVTPPESFSVTALTGGNIYFADAVFTRDQATSHYLSANPYYWPSQGSLDFYAYTPVGDGHVTKTAHNSFTVVPAAEPDETNATDLLFAIAAGQTKATGSDGVGLYFLHAMSKVVVKVKSTQPNLSFTLEQFKLAHIEQEGELTVGQTVSTASGQAIPRSDWTPAGNISSANAYIQNVGQIESVSELAQTVGSSMILVPQLTSKALKYGSDGKPDGGYIAIKGVISNKSDNSKVFPAGDGSAWMVFPVEFNLEPGKQYTYIVDLAGGGYLEEGTEGENVESAIEDSIIRFVEVTVDDWTTPEN